jgi:hypothetical protein
LDNGNVIRNEEIMVAGSGATSFNDGPRPDATQSLWQVRALDFQGIGKSSAMGQEPTHTIRPASCRRQPVSFHRLFLVGLLPAEPASPDTHREMSAEKIHAPNDHRFDPAHISVRAGRMLTTERVGQIQPFASVEPHASFTQ